MVSKSFAEGICGFSITISSSTSAAPCCSSMGSLVWLSCAFHDCIVLFLHELICSFLAPVPLKVNYCMRCMVGMGKYF